MGGASLETYRGDVAEEAKKAKQIFENLMQKHDVPRATETTESLSFGWLDDAAEGEGFIGSYGRVFDVIVMKRRDAHWPYTRQGDRISPLRKRSAVLLAPPSPPQQIATNVLIAWNCSTEQARASTLAMPPF